MAVPDALAAAFADNNAAVFIGAGLSAGAGLPTWNALIDPLRPSISDCPDDATSIDVAQFYCNEFNNTDLVNLLKGRVGAGKGRPTPAHRIVVNELMLSRVYTTNFDCLLEDACKKLRPFERIYDDGAAASLDANPSSSTLRIVKLHGDFEQPATIVITAENFDEYRETHKNVAAVLESDLRARTFLFLGYSFNDPNIRSIVHGIRQASKFSREHFIVLINPRKPYEKELKRRGLTMIALDAAPEPAAMKAAVIQWLQELKKAVRALARERLPRFPGTRYNVPEQDDDVIGRDDETLEVMDALRDHSVVRITGPSGIGKSTLALHVANAYENGSSQQTFRSIVWFAAKDGRRSTWLDELLNKIGATFDFDVITQTAPVDIGWKSQAVRLYLEKYPALLVLDSFDDMDDPELIRWLKEVPRGTRLLITTGPPAGSPAIEPDRTVWLDGLERDDALELVRRFADASVTSGALSDEKLAELAAAAQYNPQAMKLAVSLVQSGSAEHDDVVRTLDSTTTGSDTGAALASVFEQSWNSLSQGARDLVLVASSFDGVPSIRRPALQHASGLSEPAFDEALSAVVERCLLEASAGERYAVHSRTRELVRALPGDRGDLISEAQERCARYYLDYLRSTIVRSGGREPGPQYWNVLVSPAMTKIDDDWPMIRKQLEWARKNDLELLYDFVMLLIHYMDSRFYNLDRLTYAGAVADRLSASANMADEALLRIDGLGWTYIEESRFEEACEQIERGMALIPRLDPGDRVEMTAIGSAWLARLRLEQGHTAEAKRLAAAASDELDLLAPWSQMRVLMVAGDVAMKDEQHELALERYRAAEQCAVRYGGEGKGYHTGPRIGMALLGLGRFDEAQATFQELCDSDDMPIRNVYGEYGLALVRYRQGEFQEALACIERARAELRPRKGAQLLLSLLNDLFGTIQQNLENERTQIRPSSVVPTIAKDVLEHAPKTPARRRVVPPHRDTDIRTMHGEST